MTGQGEIGRGRAAGRNLTAQRGAIGGIPEQVIAIAVAVMMVAGMIAVGSQLFGSGNAGKEMANMNQMVVGLRKLYANAPVPREDLVPALVAWGGINHMINNGQVTNGWGGRIDVTGHNLNSFIIATSGIPAESCVEMVVRPPAGSITVQGPGGTVNEMPPSPVAAGNICRTNSQTVTVTYLVR